MALDTTSSDAVRNSGFYCEKDPLVGGEFLRMQREGFTLLSKDGLEFYEVNILNNKVRPSLVSLSALAYILISACDLFSIPCFRTTAYHDVDIFTVTPTTDFSSALVGKGQVKTL